MLKRVRQFILSNHLLGGKYHTVLAAVSGGIDSCVLLDLLYRLKTELKFNLMVIHFNHRARGQASRGDQHFVKNLARKYGLQIITGAADRVPRRKNETSLRELRIKFFHQALQKNPGAVLATGHTGTDQVETFIMRLAQGSHLRGLLGIKPLSGRAIHPLLGETRSTIKQYARQRELMFREDRTNKDTTILRNRIRHKIIPGLKKNLGNNVERLITRTIADLTEHYHIYEQIRNDVIKRCTRNAKGVILLNRQKYLQYRSPLRRALLEYCISKVYPLNYNVSDQSLKQWDEFVRAAQSGKKQSFKQHEIALAQRKYIHFGEVSGIPVRRFKLPLGGKAVLDKKRSLYFTRVSSAEVEFTPDRKKEYVDGTRCGSELQVRFWRRGDSFRPLGMQQEKKLSDFFIDLKLDRSLKQRIPLVCRSNEIIWVAGYRLDDRYKITERTKRYYRLELKIK